MGIINDILVGLGIREKKPKETPKEPPRLIEKKPKEPPKEPPRLNIESMYPGADSKSLILEIFEPTSIGVTLNRYCLEAKSNQFPYDKYRGATNNFSPPITIKGSEKVKVELHAYGEEFSKNFINMLPRISGDWMQVYGSISGVDNSGKFVSVTFRKNFEI